MSYDLWAIVHDEQQGSSRIPAALPRLELGRKRVMVKLATRDDWDEIIALWRTVEDRRRRRMPEIDYLAVRASDDPDWANRYPVAKPGRMTALLARLGSRVSIRIYGSSYYGTVVKVGALTADVSFIARGRTRTRTFQIMPASPWDRGIHATLRG